jgi:hypothetical protein
LPSSRTTAIAKPVTGSWSDMGDTVFLMVAGRKKQHRSVAGEGYAP